MIEVSVGEIDRREMPFAAGVLARGFRDNPNIVAALGDDPLRRVRVLERNFGAVLQMMKQPPLCARRGDWIVGVCGLAPPGRCQPSGAEMVRMLPTMLRLGPGPVSRLMSWMRVWQKLDPKERHWHLGPVAVEPGLQGLRVGSQMMERFCALMDDDGEVAYLETEKPENVRFYQRFGFETIEEADVLGAPNWFMLRQPATA